MIIKITFKNGGVKNYKESIVKYDIGFITIRKYDNSSESYPSDSIEKIEQCEDPRF